MFLLPLYYQVARGQEAWVAGLLMAPQGIGAACIMRWAGSVTDRVGPRRVVPVGILLMAVGHDPAGLRHHPRPTRCWLAVTLFVRGLGLGLSMMPVTAAAYYDLSHAEIPKASTVMNIVRLIGGSVATALFAVVLERQIVANLGAAGNEGRRERRDHRRHRQAAAGRRRPGGRGVRPHVLVVGGRDPDRLRPDPVPAEPRGNACAHGAGFGPEGAAAEAVGAPATHPSRAPASPGRCWTERSDRPDRPVHRDNDPSRLAAILAGAGFVAAEDEARELVEAAGDEPGACCTRWSSGAWPASRWPGSPVGRPSTASTYASTPASTSPAGRASRWPTAPPPDSQRAATPSTCAPVSGALAVALRQSKPRCPRRRHRHRRPRRGLRAGQRRRGLRR